jgi:clan AA aspartic protease (TIGR02281 family)
MPKLLMSLQIVTGLLQGFARAYSVNLFVLLVGVTALQPACATNAAGAGAPSKPLSASAAYSQGLSLYGQLNYAAAAIMFEKSIAQNPRDGNAVYYCALANQQIRNFARAKQLYQYAITAFPRSQPAVLSQTALQQLSGELVAPKTKEADATHTDTAPVAGSATKPGASAGESSESDAQTKSVNSGASASDSLSAKQASAKEALIKRQAPGLAKDFASLPSQGRFPFERWGRHVQIAAEVNGHAASMIFDTGAPITTMNVAAFEGIGGVMPTKQADGQIGGVGAGSFSAWRIPVTIKVGSITRVNFPLVVSQSTDAPSLLGQDFFSPFQFTIDDASSTISFTKNGTGKSSASIGGSSLSVPFRWKTRHMIVDAKINGKPYPCIFDTGAHGICFSKKALKDLNMSVPTDATMGHSSGIGGTTTDWRFCVDSISLGPIVKKDIEISVVEETGVDEPLIGQTFFDDYQYTVDYDHKIIQFLKR